MSWGPKLVLGAVVLLAARGAEEPPIELYDGRSLDGWKAVGGSGAGPVTVADGVVTLATGNPMTGITSTRADLPTVDYVLTWEARRTSGNDFFAAATFPVRDSFVTLVPGGWGGSVTGLSLIDGASAAENATNHFVRYANDTWYRFEVAVTARAIRCRIDDAEVFTCDHTDAQLRTRVESRVSQPLGFAAWRSTGQVRRAAIRPLTAAERTAIEAKLDRQE